MFSQCPRKKVSILWPAFLHHSFGEVRICTLWMGVQAKCLANVVHLHGINQTTCFQKPGISDSIFLRKGSRILFNFETNSGELTIHFLSTMYSMRGTWSGPDCYAGVPILQHWTDFLLARQSFCQNGACLFSVPVQKKSLSALLRPAGVWSQCRRLGMQWYSAQSQSFQSINKNFTSWAVK